MRKNPDRFRPTIDLTKNERQQIDKRMFSFFVASFKYSQGSSDLQNLFFQWAIHTRQISSSDIAKLSTLHESILRKAMSIPQPHTEVSMREFVGAIRTQMKKLASIQEDSTTNEEQLLKQILVNILYRDYIFLTEKQRPKRTANVRNKPRMYDGSADPRASHFRRYVFAPEKVRDPIFRKLFQKLRVLFLEIYSEYEQSHSENASSTLFEYLPIVERRWNVTHPKQSFYDPIAKHIK